jgi:hypothetical protein
VGTESIKHTLLFILVVLDLVLQVFCPVTNFARQGLERISTQCMEKWVVDGEME